MRAMLRMGEDNAVVNAGALGATDGLPQPERPVALALISTAYFRCGVQILAKYALNCAYGTATALGSNSVLAEIRYYDALQQWSQGNLPRASELITQFIDDERMKAKALELRAWIAAKAENYVKHLIDLKAAFNATAHDVWTQAAILHAIAVSARELYDEQTVAFLEFHADQVQWTEATRDKQCYVLRYLGWCAALGGRPLAAFQYFARAQHLNVSDPHQVLIDLDRAYIAGWHGEDSTFKHYLQLAQIRAQQVDWKDASETRLALLLMAELIAKSDPGTATRILQQYCDIARPLSPILTFGSGDKRRRALEEYAAGVVYRANGMRDQAIGAFKIALAIWKPINYRWRAALAALHLGDLTGRSFYTDVARILINESVPRAIIARVVDRTASVKPQV